MGFHYVGIGSRKTPEVIYKTLANVACTLARRGFILRSGAAEGADAAFEYGCDYAQGEKQIYLPWTGFNNSDSRLVVYNQEAFRLAMQFHPAWDKLSQGAKKLQARNSHQILGWRLDSPAKFVICWTQDGQLIGGTAQAIRMAQAYNIPVINAGLGLGYDDILLKVNELAHYEP